MLKILGGEWGERAEPSLLSQSCVGLTAKAVKKYFSLKQVDVILNNHHLSKIMPFEYSETCLKWNCMRLGKSSSLDRFYLIGGTEPSTPPGSLIAHPAVSVIDWQDKVQGGSVQRDH